MKIKQTHCCRLYLILFVVFTLSIHSINSENKQKLVQQQQGISRKLYQKSSINEFETSLQTQNKDSKIFEQKNFHQISQNQEMTKNQEKEQSQTQIKLQYKKIKTSKLYYDKFKDEINKIPDGQIINATLLANGKQVCLDGKACQFYYYIIPPQPSKLNLGKPEVRQVPKRNILIVSGMHGNQFIGPLSVLYSLRHLKASQTRIILFPLSNPSGYDFNQRLVHPTGVDPNRDFPIQQYNICYQSSSSLVIDSIFRRFHIDLTLALHNGQSQIGWNWGTMKENKQSHTHDQIIYRDIGEWMKYIGGRNTAIKMDQFRIGTINQVVYPVTGGFEDWAYAATWYDSGRSLNTHFSSTPSCSFQPYPQNMTNGLVFLFQLGPFTADQPLFGTEEAIHMNPNAKSLSNGYISRTVRMLNQLVKVLNPHLLIKFTNTEMIFIIQGAKKCQIAFFKVRQSQDNQIIYESSQNLQIQGNVNSFTIEPFILNLKRKMFLSHNQAEKLNRYSTKTLIIQYTLKCDPNWKGKGNTAFGKQRVFKIEQNLTLWNHKVSLYEQNYFQSSKQALQSFKFMSEEPKQSYLPQFVTESKQILFYGMIIYILCMVVIYGIFIICRQIRRDLRERNLSKIKNKIHKVNIDQSMSDNPIQKRNQQTSTKPQSMQKIIQVDSYPHLCESNKSIKSQQPQQIVQLLVVCKEIFKFEERILKITRYDKLFLTNHSSVWRIAGAISHALLNF